MFKKEYKQAKKQVRRNYLAYAGLFLGMQALALIMAFNRLTEFGKKGLPSEMISIIGIDGRFMSPSDPFFIAFILSVITCAMVVIFGYKDILQVVRRPKAVKRKYITLSMIGISIAMLLLFVPYLIPA